MLKQCIKTMFKKVLTPILRSALNKASLPLLAVLVSSAALAEVRSINKTPIDLDNGQVHIVFLDIWNSYHTGEPLATVEALPSRYTEGVMFVWVQPQFNVTELQLKEFQSTFPKHRPLVLDTNFSLLRQYGLWETPAHVILNEGRVVFSGNSNGLVEYVRNNEDKT